MVLLAFSSLPLKIKLTHTTTTRAHSICETGTSLPLVQVQARKLLLVIAVFKISQVLSGRIHSTSAGIKDAVILTVGAIEEVKRKGEGRKNLMIVK